uniref:Uncharacterized protein n=1 Tax=Fundulus heteroclitus TaxID=8078 RepID=A0A3Q2P1Y7_FUNHE
MTALQVIHLQVTFPRHQRAKSDQFQKSWKQFYRNSHKTQVSLCFFTLSLLTSCISATPVKGTADLQICLKGLKDAIEKSDAMLYTPSTTSQTVSRKYSVSDAITYTRE